MADQWALGRRARHGVVGRIVCAGVVSEAFDRAREPGNIASSWETTEDRPTWRRRKENKIYKTMKVSNFYSTVSSPTCYLRIIFRMALRGLKTFIRVH